MAAKDLTVLLQLTPHVRATHTGLVFLDGMTFEEWGEAGIMLGKVHAAIQWFVADWLNYGEAKWGETYSQMVDATGFDFGYLANIKWVGSQYPSSRRHERLSFAHHQEVAALPDPDREALLTRAEIEGWSTRDLRQRVTGIADWRHQWDALVGRAAALAGNLDVPDEHRELLLRFLAGARHL